MTAGTRLIGAEHYDTALVEAVAESTVQAAEAARRWLGRGDKEAADDASVAAMREALTSAPFAGTVVIGEGEKDEAPMLANGEHLGTGVEPGCDVAVDPLDGTRLVAEGTPGSVCVIALAPRGTMFDPAGVFYMQKIVASSAGIGVLHLDASVSDNCTALAAALGITIDRLRVAVLDKPRHRDLIAELGALDVILELRGEGDISAAIEAADPGGEIDLLLGIGGTPEGVVAACAVRALGGFMQARLAPQTTAETASALAAGRDIDVLLTLDDLVASDRVFFASTAV